MISEHLLLIRDLVRAIESYRNQNPPTYNSSEVNINLNITLQDARRYLESNGVSSLGETTTPKTKAIVGALHHG